MTVAGMSNYVRKMEREELLRTDERGFLPTQKGVEFLHEFLRALDAFVRDARARLSVIERCAAIAGASISAGDRVGLLMEAGILVAYPGRPSNSTGTALGSARKGEAVAVGDLKGIVELHPGTITIAKVPSVTRGTSAVDSGRLRAVVKDRKVAAEGPEALAAASVAGVKVDFLFGVIGAGIEAARRGLDVSILAAETEVARTVTAIEQANEGAEEPIPYDVVWLGRKRARTRAR